MNAARIHRLSGRAMIVFASLALLTVLSGFAHRREPETDEGTAAHIFQLSVVAVVPALLVFLSTADGTSLGRIVRTLVLTVSLLAIAFAALYQLEHRG
jgi:heme/copper-type cytochrome/quinol oxidase subunit 4